MTSKETAKVTAARALDMPYLWELGTSPRQTQSVDIAAALQLIKNSPYSWNLNHVTDEHYDLTYHNLNDSESGTYSIPANDILRGVKAALLEEGFYAPLSETEHRELTALASKLFAEPEENEDEDDEIAEINLDRLAELSGFGEASCRAAFKEVCTYYADVFAFKEIAQMLESYLSEGNDENRRAIVMRFCNAAENYANRVN